MDEKKIKWGIIGCGNVTEKKSGPAFNLVPGSSLDYVMRRDEVKLKDYASRHGIKNYSTNADDIICNPDIDAIYIATPPHLHREYALKVANARKICCVEKPMAMNYKECEEMVSAFESIDKDLFVAYYRRSLPYFNKVKELINDNSIGKIRHVNWEFSHTPFDIDFTNEYNWRVIPSIAGGGYFVDLASHGLDLFIYLFGNIKEVSGLKQNQQGLYEAEDAVSACWSYENGILGSGYWNFGSYKDSDLVTIHGDNGVIRFSIFELVEIHMENNEGVKTYNIEHPVNIQYYHVENIIKHLNGLVRHPALGKDCMGVALMMDKILNNHLESNPTAR